MWHNWRALYQKWKRIYNKQHKIIYFTVPNKSHLFVFHFHKDGERQLLPLLQLMTWCHTPNLVLCSALVLALYCTLSPVQYLKLRVFAQLTYDHDILMPDLNHIKLLNTWLLYLKLVLGNIGLISPINESLPLLKWKVLLMLYQYLNRNVK